MSKSWIVVLFVAGSIAVAFAGKQERDLMTKTVMPQVKDAQEKFQSSCGCALEITVDDTALKSMDEIRNAGYIAKRISEGVPKYCTDAASKKAMCQLKSLSITKGKPAGFTFKDGKGVATTDGQAGCGWEQITRVLDK